MNKNTQIALGLSGCGIFLFIWCYFVIQANASIYKIQPDWRPVSFLLIQQTPDGYATARVYLDEEAEGQPWAWSVLITPKIQRPSGYMWQTGACKTCAEAKEAAIKWLEERK